MENINIGLVGIGYFGNFHLNNILNTPFNLKGFFDIDKQKALEIEKKTGVKKFNDYQSLLNEIDAIVITTPTVYHHELAIKAIEAGKHIFIEKPMVSNSEQAIEILKALENKNLIFQVGHIERFNPAFDIEELKQEKIIKIEANRFSTYNPRGTDVSVVFDLMIHDIDLMLYIMGDKIDSIVATGDKQIGSNIEFCSAAISFEQGNLAVLNASIIHPYMERIFKIWTDKAFYKLDLANKNIDKYIYANKPDKENIIFSREITEKKEANNSILDELNEFYNSITKNLPVRVSANDGYKAVKLAEDILKKIKS